MRTKTAYRKFKDGGRVNPESVEVNYIPVSDDVAPQASEAQGTAALKAQMESLRNAQAHQDYRARHQSPSRDDVRSARIAEWIRQGLGEAEADLLRANPDMIDMPE